MSELIKEYHSCKEIALIEIEMFHARYENIHPFQTRNERTGRGILYKECLKNNIVPMIIENAEKA